MHGIRHAFVIRPAQPQEVRACQMLLLRKVEVGPDCFLLVAAENAPNGRLLGAMVGGGGPTPDDPAMAALVHVVPSYRRQGIGRGLIAAAVGLCRGRAPMLRAMRPVPANSVAAKFLIACGFTSYRDIVHSETDLAKFHADLWRLRQKLEQRRTLPAEARVVRLREAPADSVASLVCRHFPMSEAYVLGRLQPGKADSFDVENSVALMVGDTLAGVVMYLWQQGLPLVEIRAVAQPFRRGWANVLLMEAAGRTGLAAGARRFRFFSDRANSDTIRLGHRSSADEILLEHWFWRVVG